METKTILLYDFDDDVADTIHRMLETTSHHVILVRSPADVLATLSKRRVDIVLTNEVDSILKGGESLPWMIRAVQPGVAIILTTRRHAQSGYFTVIDAVLPKPFSIADLKSAIAAVSRHS